MATVPLRFFGRRKGKGLTPSRQRLLDNLLPKVSITKEKAKKIQKSFGVPVNQVWLEVGFGGGEHLAELAFQNPNVGIIGAEPFINGVASLLAYLNGSHRYPHDDLGLEQGRTDNVRIWPDDIRLLFPLFPDKVFNRIFVLYPDPWPKARHAERRFINATNLPELYRLLADNGELIVATDVIGYADWVKEQMVLFNKFSQVNPDQHQPPADWVSTRYEQKGIKAGRQPNYFIFCKKSKKVLDGKKKIAQD